MRFMRTTCRHVWFRSMNAAICANHLEIDSNCQPNELIILRPYKYIFLLSGKCWVIFYLWCRYSHRFSMDLILLDRIIYILRANRKKTEIPYCWEVLWCLESCFIFMNAFHSKWLANANVSQMFFFVLNYHLCLQKTLPWIISLLSKSVYVKCACISGQSTMEWVWI